MLHELLLHIATLVTVYTTIALFVYLISHAFCAGPSNIYIYIYITNSWYNAILTIQTIKLALQWLKLKFSVNSAIITMWLLCEMHKRL